jgi:hypothetical protein
LDATLRARNNVAGAQTTKLTEHSARQLHQLMLCLPTMLALRRASKIDAGTALAVLAANRSGLPSRWRLAPDTADSLWRSFFLSQYGDGIELPPLAATENRKWDGVGVAPPSSTSGQLSYLLLPLDPPTLTPAQRTSRSVQRLDAIAAAYRNIEALVSRVDQKMAPYFQAIERTPSFANAPHTLMRLPAAAWPQWMKQRIGSAIGHAQTDIVEVPLAPLLAAFEIADADTAGGKGIGEALAGIEIGVEPPPATWTATTKAVMLFPQPEANGERYLAAGVLRLMGKIDCFSLVAHEDAGCCTAAQVAYMQSMIELLTDLSVNLETRLAAHLRYRITYAPQLGDVKEVIYRWDRLERANFYNEVIDFARCASPVSEETASFIYSLRIATGVRKPVVFADLGAAPARKKVKAVAAQEAAAQATPIAITIDHARVSELMNETAEIKRQLATIFVDSNDTHVNPQSEKNAQPDAPVAQSQVAGLTLKSALAVLFAELLAAETMTAAEMDALCHKHGLMSGAAVESINDVSIDTYGVPAIAIEGASVKIEQEFKEAIN